MMKSSSFFLTPTPNPPLPQPHTKIILQAFSYLYSEGETRPSIFVTMYKDFQTRERERKKYIYGVHIYICLRHTILILVQTNSSSD